MKNFIGTTVKLVRLHGVRTFVRQNACSKRLRIPIKMFVFFFYPSGYPGIIMFSVRVNVQIFYWVSCAYA